MTPLKAIPLAIAGKAVSICLRMVEAPVSLLARAYRLGAANRSLTIPLPVTTQFDGAIRIHGTGDMQVGDHCRLGLGAYFETSGPGRIRMGGRVRINTGCHLVAHAELAIGDDVLIGEYVSIRDADHGTAVDQPMNRQAHRTAAIRIGSNVWIGRGSCVLKGVTIGDGAIIAANSVVTRDIGAMEIHAGVPARLLRRRDVQAGVVADDRG
jgi:acetyltransferase-like isoleucine patch superfamily enzyme